MDTQFSDLFLQDCQMLRDFDSASDAGYYSANDGLSPTSSVDSVDRSWSSPSALDSVDRSWSSPSALDSVGCSCSSPPSPHWSLIPEGPYVNSQFVQRQISARSGNQVQTAGVQHQEQVQTSNMRPIQVQVPAMASFQQQRAAFPLQGQSQACKLQRGRRSRSWCAGRKRLCASEREKLRMRDLTNALHRLRTYLPPSMAPEGQALTKVQTLRLAVRYIAHLSAQLRSRDGGACQSPDQPHAQNSTRISPAQRIRHCLQYQPRTHCSHHMGQYSQRCKLCTLIQQNQRTIANNLTSVLQQDMTSCRQAMVLLLPSPAGKRKVFHQQ